MIVGRYSLDLYCNNEGVYPDGIHDWREFPHEYTHEYGSRCRWMARKDGWILKRDGGAICPKCNPRKRGGKE